MKAGLEQNKLGTPDEEAQHCKTSGDVGLRGGPSNSAGNLVGGNKAKH